MLTKLLHISLLSIHIQFISVFSFVFPDKLLLPIGAVVWLLIFYSLLHYKKFHLLGMLLLLVILVSVCLLLVMLMLFVFRNIPTSDSSIKYTIQSISGMIYALGNPLLSSIILVRSYSKELNSL